ncbi:MAG TPA: hypothetical protein VER11_33235 [Polyangiaceae bacterium]|nr:hypothetical protein [Polyangiaceae bacterium]
MNSKRSMWKLLVGVASVGLFVTNCTIKSTDDDANGCTPGNKKDCTACNGVTGSQTCQDDGTYGDCVCPGSSNAGASSGGASSGGASSTAGSSSSNGGASYTAGYGGAAPSDGGASPGGAGEGGEGGAGVGIDPTDCTGCLNQLCAPEWEQCVLEDEKNPDISGGYCLSSTLDGSGQMEAVLGCIEKERMNGLVKRDAVRACGSSLGQSADPSFFQWPPDDMTPVTAQVLNCMADSPDEVDNPGAWADSTNIPSSGSPKPWIDGTCAKLACTSAQN